MKIVILTGAGISAESGLQTFRTGPGGGLWNNHKVEDVATPEGFSKNPSLVFDFYNQARKNVLEAEPNSAHFAISKLQKSRHEVILITQNIDDLHERAGSENVLHMHGSIFKVLCSNCREVHDVSTDVGAQTLCASCYSPSLRPDVVWFGENPYHMDFIDSNLRKCDLFVSIGTSGKVYPAAGFARIAKKKKAHTLEINIENTYNRDFREFIEGSATETVPEWVDEIIA